MRLWEAFGHRQSALRTIKKIFDPSLKVHTSAAFLAA
jgi:hypothetical protein